MILKLLLVIAVIGVVYFMFIKKKPIKNSTKNETTKNEKNEKPQSNDMVECSTCGIYAELSDSILSNNKYYCSDECVGKS